MFRELVLMMCLTLLLVGIAYVIGYLVGVNPMYTAMYGLLLSIPLNIITYLLSDKIVLMMTRAKIVSEYEAPRLHKIVERVARRAGIPKPKVAIVPSDIPNAFATGRGPSSAVVAVTRGALSLFTDDELEAVIGHEISHIKHRDLLIATMAAVIASAVGWLAYMARWGAYIRVLEDRDEESTGVALIALIASILVPIFALMIQMAISREREYKADEGSAYVTRKPYALISALEKIEREVRRRGSAMDMNPSTSSLWIVNPFRGSTLMELFSTHPPTWKRIERLKRIAKELGIY